MANKAPIHPTNSSANFNKFLNILNNLSPHCRYTAQSQKGNQGGGGIALLFQFFYAGCMDKLNIEIHPKKVSCSRFQFCLG